MNKKMMSVLTDSHLFVAFELLGTKSITIIIRESSGKGQKRYLNNLMSIRPEPSAKVVTKTGNS
jgi:hypothetical protein